MKDSGELAPELAVPATPPTDDAAAEKPSFFIFVPAFGDMVSTTTFLSVQCLTAALAQKGISSSLTAVSNPELSESRNVAASLWYDRFQTSHLLMVDADMGFEPQLVLDMLALDEPLVGTLYRKKSDKVSWAGSGFPMDGKLSEVAGARLHSGNFLEVEGVGMGVCLIRRDCITAMLDKFPQISDERAVGNASQDREHDLKSMGVERLIRCFDPLYIPERGRISEDLSFCIRHRMAGGKVWAAIGHNVQHVGKKIYEGSFLKRQLTIEASAHLKTDAAAETSMVTPPQMEATP